MSSQAWRLFGALVFAFPLAGALAAAPLAASAAPAAASSAAPAAKAAKSFDPRAWPTAYEPVTMTVKELLAAAKRYDGSAPEGQKTLRTASTFRDGGMTGTTREVWVGEDYRVDSTLGPFVTAEGRNDGQQWATNENGYTLLKRGIHKRAEANARALENPNPGDEVQLLGRLRAPADVYVLRVAPPDGREERRFYDAKTFALVRRETSYLGHLVVTTYEDFRTVNGVTLAFKRTVSDGHPENDYVETTTKLEIGVPVAEGEVAIPGSRRLPVKLPDGVSSVRLPARMDDYGRIIVRVTINGRGLDFQLDSGASGIVLDRDVARQLGLTTSGRWSNTVAGTFVSTNAVVPRAQVGPITMSDLVVEALPFNYQNDWNTKVVGLLGFDFIAGAVLKIDYANGTVDAIPSEKFTPPENGVVLDAILDDNVPMITMKMNDALGSHFILDTGSDLVIAFSGFAKRFPDAVDDHSEHKIVSRILNVVGVQGVGGRLSMHGTILKSMQLGNVHYKDYLALVLLSDQDEFEGEDADGLAGIPLLRTFDVYLDYANSRVVLVPNKFTKRITSDKP